VGVARKSREAANKSGEATSKNDKVANKSHRLVAVTQTKRVHPQKHHHKSSKSFTPFTKNYINILK
jgi:hypothetical protein